MLLKKGGKSLQRQRFHAWSVWENAVELNLGVDLDAEW